MHTCNHCDSHVSRRFYTVFAAPNGGLHACPNCSATAGIAEVSKERVQRLEWSHEA